MNHLNFVILLYSVLSATPCDFDCHNRRFSHSSCESQSLYQDMEGSVQSAKCLKKGDCLPPLKRGVYRLYSNRFCPFCKRVLLVLTTKQLAVEVVNIDMRSKPEWFLEKNPLGQVPVLELDDEIVTDSMNIVKYLEKNHPCPQLFPDDWDKEQRLLDQYNKTIPSAMYKFFTEPEEKLPEVWESFQHLLDPFECELAKRGTPYFGGAEFPSILDLLFWPWLELAQVAPKLMEGAHFDQERFPKLGNWVKILERQPFVYLTAVEYPIMLEFLREYRSGNCLYDLGLP